MSLTLEQLAKALGLEFVGDAGLALQGVASPQSAGPGDLCYVLGKKHLLPVAESACSAVILPPDCAQQLDGKALLLSEDPQFSFVQAIDALQLEIQRPRGVIHPSAQIAASAELGDGVSVGANAVIEEDVRIGADTVIGPGCVIDNGATIGDQCYLHGNVTIAHSVRLGNRCILQSGVVIGGDGFGLTMHENEWRRIPQLGSVVLEDDVEVGANSTIDRGALDDTVIEKGVKIDNLVLIAHNCRVGAHTAIAGCVGMAGSTRIGRYCLISGAATINGHTTIADKTTLTGMAMVTNNITEPGGVYSSGVPAMENALWRRISARYKSLDKLARTVARLEKQVGDESSDN